MKRSMWLVISITLCALVIVLVQTISSQSLVAHNEPSLDEGEVIIEGSSLFSLESLDDLGSYSTDIFRVTLIKEESFNELISEFVFKVNKVFKGKADDEIVVIDARGRYTQGNDYILFSEDGSGYDYIPFVYYVVFNQSSVVEITSDGMLLGNQNVIKSFKHVSDFEEYLLKSFTDVVDDRRLAMERNREAEEPDFVLKGLVASKSSIHKYLSGIQIKNLDTVYGEKWNEYVTILAPTDIEVGQEYYFYLKCDEDSSIASIVGLREGIIEKDTDKWHELEKKVGQ